MVVPISSEMAACDDDEEEEKHHEAGWIDWLIVTYVCTQYLISYILCTDQYREYGTYVKSHHYDPPFDLMLSLVVIIFLP